MKTHHLSLLAIICLANLRLVQGHGLTIFVNKCDNQVTTNCCDLSNAPDSINANHKEPDFGRTIFPNLAFSLDPNAPQIYVADLGVEYRGSVWDATNPECADGEDDAKPPSPCWRFEPDGSDFPAFTPFRCSKDDSFNFFSVNIAQPLKYWNGKEFIAAKNGERLKIYGQDWPEPDVLEEPNNPLGAGKWAAVLGASTTTPRSVEEGVVLGADIADEEIEWTSAGNAKGQNSPYTFQSSFEKDLSWGENENWADSTAGLKWNDHEHYLYQLVDKNGELCVKGTTPPSNGANFGADSNVGDAFTDDCANGVYYLVMTVTVDGVTSPPIEVLFARGVDMTGPAMQGAFAKLQNSVKSQNLLGAEEPSQNSDKNRSIGIAGLVVASVAFILAAYAAFKPVGTHNTATAMPEQIA